MINIKCTYENGNTSTTRVNATIEEAKEYYLGKIFNIGTVEDNLQKCIKVEII